MDTGLTLAAAPGLDVHGSQGVQQERLCPTGAEWAQMSGHNPYRRHTGMYNKTDERIAIKMIWPNTWQIGS